MTGLIKEVLSRHVPPAFLSENIRNALSDAPPDADDMTTEFPLPRWAFAKKRQDGSFMPQNIAHRGNKAKHPENTMGAFRSAVGSGVNAVETDIHVTRDGVVVLSHDANLKRCFGRDEAIIDCDWKFVSTLTTLKEPHERMPRLADLLTYLAEHGNEDVWVLLDIKLDVDPTVAMSLIAKAIREVAPSPKRPWDQRIILGFWSAKYLPLCKRFLPTFPVTYIGFSSLYARQFFGHPHVCFNMLAKILLLWPFGPKFIRDAHARSRSVLVWTVNDDKMMRWAIKNGLDGVITDDPARFKEVCEEWTAGKRETGLGLKDMLEALYVNILALLLGYVFIHLRSRQRRKYHWDVMEGKTVAGP